MQKKLVLVILCAILLLAAGIRLYNLSSLPPGPHLDEVSNGFNAYSLLKTGNDEYGRRFPLLLQAYNDYRPALFVYSSIPFIKIFGMSSFSIRLPTVILTIAAIISLFFLIKLIKNDDSTALAGAFLYTISPWSLYSSRFSNEVNMSLSFFIFGLTFFLFWIKKPQRGIKSLLALFTFIVFFVLAFYAYHGIKLFLPIFLALLGIVFYKAFLKRKIISLLAILFGIVMLIPLIYAFDDPQTKLRLGAVNIFTQNPQIREVSAKRLLHDKTINLLSGQLFDNRRTLFFLEIAKNYLKNYDLSWLFTYTDNKSFQIPDFGPMYLFELPLLLLGAYILIRENRITKKMKLLIFIWAATATLPSAFTNESPHLNRTNTLLPGLIVIESFGLTFLMRRIWQFNNVLFRTCLYTSLGGIIGVSFIWLLHAYFVLLPYNKAKAFQYGALQAMEYAIDHEKNYQTITVSNAQTLLNGYMYYLFASQYDPELYQKQGGTKSAFFTDEHFIGKYKFLDFNHYYGEERYKKEHPTGPSLYITNPSEIPQSVIDKKGISLIKKFYFPDGTDAIWIMREEGNN